MVYNKEENYNNYNFQGSRVGGPTFSRFPGGQRGSNHETCEFP